jgi:hypothetical protein
MDPPLYKRALSRQIGWTASWATMHPREARPMAWQISVLGLGLANAVPAISASSWSSGAVPGATGCGAVRGLIWDLERSITAVSMNRLHGYTRRLQALAAEPRAKGATR